ncbi:ABC transporter permease [Treponema phagedenis]|uniref:ABC transporter permease n=1 Tax=Treponema phagedenis TaxID=162 RepID=UPI0001F63C44|nr:ABC transporter permease subunit [Treponema phagedenis]EFW37986.1 ABC transporter, permease protein [Treponema phagedenis F0421]
MQKKLKEAKGKRHFFDESFELALLSLPTTIWYFLFSFLPMFGVIIAFKNYRIFGPGFIGNLIKSKWVGFDNFAFLFKTKNAWLIVRNTLGFNAIFIVLGIVIPISLAVLLSLLYNQHLGKIYQTMMFLPHFLSWVVVSYFLYAFLNAQNGLFNHLIVKYGGTPIQWYAEKAYWPWILIFMSVWKGMGYGTVMYLAAITGIDKSLYEAAYLDGASRWQGVKYITIPSLKSLVIILFIMSLGGIFRADFGLFYQVPMNSAFLYDITTVFDTYVYRAIGTVNIGMSAAAAFFQSIMGFILIFSSNFLIRKLDRNAALF